MAGIVGIYASIGDHIPILDKKKFDKPKPEGEISRYHYRGTVMVILVMCLLVTTTEWISGTDSIINCLHTGAIPDHVMESYCYIMGTFSVPHHYVDDQHEIGEQISQSGVGPYNPQVDYIEIKAYYQWVPFMLFMQAIMFYMPHTIYKAFEGGKIENILAGLNRWACDAERRNKESDLAAYMVESSGSHRQWSWHLLVAQSLYLINVVGQIYLTDCFLGWEFSTYGVRAASFLEDQQQDRIDPMSRIFPRVAKCTFNKFGPSGTIQRHDAQCILPINIINEKIYVLLWFWFCILTPLTCIHLIWSFFLVFSVPARRQIIVRKLKLSPRWWTYRAKSTLSNQTGTCMSKKDEAAMERKMARYYFSKDQDEDIDNGYVDVDMIVQSLDYGDWKLFYHLLSNMDALVFGEFCQSLCRELTADRHESDTEVDDGRVGMPMAKIHDDKSKQDDDKGNSESDSNNSDDDDDKPKKSGKRNRFCLDSRPEYADLQDKLLGDPENGFLDRNSDDQAGEGASPKSERRESFYNSDNGRDRVGSPLLMLDRRGMRKKSKKKKNDNGQGPRGRPKNTMSHKVSHI